jgi:uncharacterized protein YjbJ (UPF0337 family)
MAEFWPTEGKTNASKFKALLPFATRPGLQSTRSTIGKVVGRNEMQADGAVDKAAGTIQKKVDDVKETAGVPVNQHVSREHIRCSIHPLAARQGRAARSRRLPGSARSSAAVAMR